MTDYKEMYITLFNEITEVVEKLQLAQRKTEELYIKVTTPVFKIEEEEWLSKENPKKNNSIVFLRQKDEQE